MRRHYACTHYPRTPHAQVRFSVDDVPAPPSEGAPSAPNSLSDFAHDAVSTITGHDDHHNEPQAMFGNDDTIWGDMPKMPADQYDYDLCETCHKARPEEEQLR